MRTSWSLLAVLALATAGCVGGDSCKCSKDIAKYYSELNCSPIKEAGACCPTEYDCAASLGARSKEKCHLKGKAYDPNTRISSAEVGNPCVPECRCNKFGPQASFQCVNSECPDLFEEPLAEGCVHLYSPGSCCSTGTHCGTNGERVALCANASSSAAKDSAKCQYGGKTYVLGQQFYPSEEPCKKCICQEGFDGSLNGPWCEDVSCGIEIHYGAKILDGCAPVFYGASGCCPIYWRCPSGEDAVVPATPNNPTSASSGTCSFGSLRLNVGDSLSKEKTCVECSCVVPPHVTCVQDGYC